MQNINVIEKHKYPFRIYIFMSCLVLIFITTIPSFFMDELQYHRIIGKKISEAKKFFLARNYEQAIVLYLEIIKKHPNFKKGKIKIAQSYFALSRKFESFYYAGLSFLKDEKFSKSQVSKLRKSLPENYQQHFNLLFKL